MKKNYLMEIIREEISSYLGENEEMNSSRGEEYGQAYNSPTHQRDVMNQHLARATELRKKLDAIVREIEQLEITAAAFNVNELAFEVAGKNKKAVMSFKDKTAADTFGRENQVKVTPLEEEQLDEETLNEMAFSLKKGLAPSEKLEPRYKKENFKKVVDLILSKVDGKKTMADVARELGVIQQKIRPVISDLIDAGILETGEAESKSGKDVPNKPGRKATEKPAAAPKSTKEKAAPATKAEKPAATKAEPVDKEDAAAMKMAASVKGGALTAGEKYGKLKKALETKTAELKALAGSTDMEKRKALTAEKMRIEDAMEKLKQVKM